MGKFDPALHLPVDDLRLWVCSGMADSVPWTEQSEHQFQLAEAAACAVARTYAEAGFAVAIDHCRNPKRMEQVAIDHLSGFNVTRVLLMPELETNLHRNETRTNKPFAPSFLEETIRSTNAAYRDGIPDGWLRIDNSRMTVEETVEEILKARSQD